MVSSSVSIKKESLQYDKTGILSPLITEYLKGADSLKSFYSYTPELSSFEKAMEARKKFPFYRKELASILLEQNQHLLENYPEVNSNIKSLSDENTFTVTTGHQLCIFTGPLYFIYKIISTINLAEQLNKKYPENHFVPVYWMAAEDHDFEEINHIHLFNKKLKWELDAKGAAGDLDPETMNGLFAELKEVMGNSEHAKELFTIFEEAYMFNNNLADATRFLVYKLLGEYGVVVFDGNEPELKKLFIPVIKDELVKQSSFDLVDATSKKLQELGYKAQVNPRSINLFFMEDGVRERIVKAPDGHFEVVNTDLSFSAEMMLNLMETQPERFSPNVVLRPLYQEYILPNLAYVGGPGELSYWLQYRSMFEYHHVHFPVLIQRGSVLLVDQQLNKKLSQFRMTPADLFIPVNDLIHQFIKEEAGDFDITEINARFKQVFDSLREKANAIDQSLAGTVNAEEQKLVNAVDGVKKKVLAAVKRQNETSVQQLKATKEKVFPEGVLQERYLNFIPFYLQYGKAFIEMLKQEIDVTEKGMIVLTLE
ncbi:MAG: bacillithiol biosynthesis cysteine-adding enzyme BshC [Bacteroidota bacterium]